MYNHPIAAALEKRGIRRDWFSGRVGVSPSRLTHILAGRRPAPPDFYRLAALVLDMDEAEIRPAQASRDVVAGLETLVLAPADPDTREAAQAA